MHTFHSNEPPKVLLEVENSEYLAFLSFFSKAKTEKCNRTNLSVSNKFEMVIPRSATYFLELRARFTESSHQRLFQRQKTLKI